MNKRKREMRLWSDWKPKPAVRTLWLMNGLSEKRSIIPLPLSLMLLRLQGMSYFQSLPLPPRSGLVPIFTLFLRVEIFYPNRKNSSIIVIAWLLKFRKILIVVSLRIKSKTLRDQRKELIFIQPPSTSFNILFSLFANCAFLEIQAVRTMKTSGPSHW